MNLIKQKSNKGAFSFILIFIFHFISTYTLFSSATDSSLIKATNDTLKNTELFPIVSYDSDFGYGIGGKCLFINQIGYNESFGVGISQSTKGEFWSRISFSLLDEKFRHRKKHPISFDFYIDYDKFKTYNFFGIGGQANSADREEYSRQTTVTSAIFSYGITQDIVAQAGVQSRYIRNFNIDPEGNLRHYSVALNIGNAYAYSLISALKYDTRNNPLNASSGIVLNGEMEYAPNSKLWNVSYFRYLLNFQYYQQLYFDDLIFAMRANYQQIVGHNLPIQFLLPMGGSKTLRGYPQDRYLDKLAAMLNFELRFPIAWRFGGVAGLDMGKVCNCPTTISLHDWPWNGVLGLRYLSDSFILRLDFGISKESDGIYLNFNQQF